MADAFGKDLRDIWAQRQQCMSLTVRCPRVNDQEASFPTLIKSRSCVKLQSEHFGICRIREMRRVHSFVISTSKV
jgi:hypothetical protein